MAKRGWLAAAVSAVLLLTAACGGAGGGEGASGDEQVVQIGHLANLTGAAAALGQPYKQGIDLALEEIESEGFLDEAGVSLEILTEDTNSTPTNAVTIFNEFEREGVPVTVSDGISPIALAVGPLANESEIVFLNGAGSGTEEEDFEFHLSDIRTQYEELAPYLVSEGGPRVAAIVGTDNPALPVLVDNLESALAGAGGELVARESVEADDSDFSSVLTNVRETNPDVVFISTLADQAGNVLAQLDRAGGFDDVLKSVQSGVSRVVADVAGPAAQGVVLRPAWSPGAPNSEEFVAAYQEAYDGASPDTNSAFGYHSAWVIATAISMAVEDGEEITGEAIRSRIPDAADSPEVEENGLIPDLVIPADGSATWPGVLSTFNENGDIEALDG